MQRLNEVHDVTTAWDDAKEVTVMSLTGEGGEVVATIEIALGAENGRITFTDATAGPHLINIAEFVAALSKALATKHPHPTVDMPIHRIN